MRLVSICWWGRRVTILVGSWCMGSVLGYRGIVLRGWSVTIQRSWGGRVVNRGRTRAIV